MTDTLMELTGDASLAAWIPADYYASLIMEASVCHSQLSGIFPMNFDAAQGTGGIVQVRYAPARTAQGPYSSGCGCLSRTSMTMGTYSINIYAYGDADTLCDYSLWKADGPTKDVVFNEMSKALAKKRDETIWSALTAFKPTYYSKLSVACGSQWQKESTYCCAFKVNLYNAVVSAKQNLKKVCKNPDYVILNPDVAKYFYLKDYALAPGNLVTFDTNGNLLTVAGLKVIESGNATACNSTSGATMAVVIDSSRAVGEAWGMKPKLEEERIPYCDYTIASIWMYWGAAAMDTDAIVHIINP